ncbi:MAG: hypothetical protein RMJ34_03345 [candidate division WOR-3 bacterium]|nr:hypothetical protein [candidate division WOR-3 bacterium]
MLLREINRLRRKIFLTHFSIFFFSSFSLIIILFLLLISRFLIFEGSYLIIFLFFLFLFLFFLYQFIKKRNYFPFFKDYSLIKIAQSLDENFENLNKELTPAVSFLKDYEKYKESKENYSLSLIDWAIKNGEKRFKENYSFIKKNLLKRLGIKKRLKESFCFFSVSFFVFLLYFIIFPIPFKIGFYSLFDKNKLPIYFQVEPQNFFIKKGEKVEIKVRVISPFKFKKVNFVYGKDFKKKTKLALSKDSAKITLVPKEEFDYYFEILNLKSPIYRINFFPIKSFSLLNLKILPPSYTQLPPTEYSFPKEISAIVGSLVMLKTEPSFNKVLTEERIISENKDSCIFSLLKEEEKNLMIILNNETTYIRINFLSDEYPYITFLFPNKDIDIPESMKIPLRIYLLDDFQVKEAKIYGIKEKDTFLVKNFVINKKIDTLNFLWDLTDLNLLPGNEIFYYAVCYDNDIIKGPKVSKTNIYKIRFPTIEEIFTKTTERIENVYSEVSKEKTGMDEVLKEVEKLERAFKERRELSYEERKSLSNLLEKNKDLINKISELKKEIEDFLKELEEYPLFDPATLNKLMELFRILDEILPQELKERLLKLREELGKSKNWKEYFSQLKMSTEELKEMVERAERLLKNLLNSAKLKEWEKKFEELAKLQEEIEKDIEKLPIEKQKEIEKNLANLEKEIKEYRFENKDYQEFQKELKELLEKLDLKERAGKIAQEMEKNNLASAKNFSSSLRKDLKNLSNRLRDFQKGISEKNKERIFNNLLKIGFALNDLSKESKDLINFSIKDEESEKDFGKKISLLNKSIKLLSDSLISLSNQSLLISPKLAQGLIKGILELEKVSRYIAEKNFNYAKNILEKVKLNIDNTLLSIIYLLNQRPKGGGGGLEDFLNALQQASEMLGELLSEMGGLPIPMPMGGMDLARLQEMVNKLRALREMLEQSLKTLSSEPGLTSSMEGILEEMKKVEEDLSKLNIKRELIERTAGIYRRLLDVERSIRKKEEREEYEAEVGKEYEAKEKIFLPKDYGERKRYLQEEILKILKEDFPKEYYPLIKEYFYKLLEE